MKGKPLFYIFFLILFTGCQIGFYLQEDRWGADSIRGATDTDRALMFHHESLRTAYKAGELTEADGLKVYSNLKYVIQEEGDVLYIVFFGTDTAEDVYYDMIHWKEPFWTDVDPDIAVHAGFNRPFQDIAPEIREAVQLYLDGAPPTPRVLLSGHSAGGVQAVLCAFYLSREFTSWELDDIYCQIGGSPAPGNKAFADAVEAESRITLHRYRNGSDMMPGMLTEEMGYYHAGQPYHIGPDPDPFTTSSLLWLTWHFIGDYADSLRAE